MFIEILEKPNGYCVWARAIKRTERSRQNWGGAHGTFAKLVRTTSGSLGTIAIKGFELKIIAGNLFKKVVQKFIAILRHYF